MKLIPSFCIILSIFNLASGELLQKTGPRNSDKISSDLKLTTCYNDLRNELNEIASDEWSRIHQNFSTTIYKFEESAKTSIMDGINVTSCVTGSKGSTLQTIVTAIEKNDRMLINSMIKIEKIFHDEIWLPEMRRNWPDCYEKQPLNREILQCIDKNVLRNPTVNKLTMHQNFVNAMRFRSESVISEMKNSSDIMKQSLKSSIQYHEVIFNTCILEVRISTAKNLGKDSITRRNQTGTSSTKEKNSENPNKTHRLILQEIEDKYGLTIENTNSFTSNSFQHVLNIMIENGKNVMCCFDPAIEHVNNATKQAQIEHSQCFKNQSDEFQISVITEISTVETMKSSFKNCLQEDIFLNQNSTRKFIDCLDYDVMNKNVYQNFELKMEEYIKSHRGLLDSCLRIVMATYRDSVTHGHIKFDSCVSYQITKQCNRNLPIDSDRAIKILSKNLFDDKYNWVLWAPDHLPLVPRLG